MTDKKKSETSESFSGNEYWASLLSEIERKRNAKTNPSNT